MRCPECSRRLPPGTPCPAHPQPSLAAVAPEAPPPPQLPGLDSWSLLGRGGFAAVFAARDEGGRRVAVKIALRRGDLRIAREAEALRRVGPPAVPALHGTGTSSDGRPYFVMERLSGGTLAELMASRQEAAFAVAEAAALVRGLADVVGRVHAVGLVHRDLKPENVFVTPSGIRLIDLGLGVAAAGEPLAALTLDGERLGTPTYMSPEQASLAGDSVASDLYALGVILYELVTGRPPFVGSDSEILRAHATLRPPSPSQLGAAPILDEVVARCLAKRPSQRYASTAELSDAIAAALASGASRPAAATQERAGHTATTRVVALLGVQSHEPVAHVSALVAAHGGTLARTHGRRAVFAFANADSPADGLDSALAAAEALAGVAAVRLIHLAELRLRVRGGGVVLSGRALDRLDDWWPPATPAAVLFTQAASSARGGAAEEVVPSLYTVGRQVEIAPEPPEPALRGRDELLSALCTRRDGDAPVLSIVTGDVGLGKSRLIQAAAERFCGTSLLLLSGRKEDDGELVRRLLRFALRLERDDPDVEAVRAACATLGGDLAPTWPAAAHALGLVAADHPPVTELVRLRGSLRATVSRLAAAGLQRRAAGGALAIVLDDGHLADATTLDALDAAVRSRSALPLYVVIAAHPRLAGSRPQLGQGARVERHVLAPLARQESEALVRDCLRPVERVPEDVVARLTDVTAGVPLFVHELLHTLRKSGAIRRHRGASAWYLAPSVARLAGGANFAERLAREATQALPPPILALAQLCVVLGDDFDATAVEALQERVSEDDPVARLDALAGLERLARAAALAHDGARFRFRHTTLREGVELITPAAPRRTYHAAARAALLARADHLTRRERLRLAHHHAVLGDRTEAATQYLELAAADAALLHDVEAEDEYGQALAQLLEGDVRLRMVALGGRGHTRVRLERLSESLDDLRAARALAETLGDERALVGLLLDESTLLDWCNDFAGSAEAAQRAWPMAAQLADDRLLGRAHMARARAHYRAGRPQQCWPEYEEAIHRARAAGDVETQIESLLLLAPALIQIERLDDAARRFDEVMELCRARGDRLHEAAALGNRMLLWVTLRQYDRAIDDARRATELAHALGRVVQESLAEVNLAHLLFWTGDAESAALTAERAVALSARYFENPPPDAMHLLARVYTRTGRLADARRQVEWLRRHRPSLMPSDELLLKMVEARLGPAPPDHWRALVAGADTCTLLADELGELLSSATAALVEARRWSDARAVLARWRQATAGAENWTRLRAALEERIASEGV